MVILILGPDKMTSHSIEPYLPTLKVESLTGVQWALTIMEHTIEPYLPTLKVESLTGVQWDLTIMEHTIPGRVSQEYGGTSL